MTRLELPPVEEAVADTAPWLWWALRGESGRLAGMAQPAADYDFGLLAAQGLDTVVSLVGAPAYDPAPLRPRTFELHNLAAGGLPPDPAAEEREVAAAVAEVCALLDAGRNVVVHCHAGIGRTGTVIGSVLAARGLPPDEVVDWLDRLQRRRTGRGGWPESAWQRAMVHRAAPAG
jgi:Protein-tyrosine phosphatase